MVAKVNLEKCTGCGTCKDVCPVEAIELNDEKAKLMRKSVRTVVSAWKSALREPYH
jgi:formate hydrogenlyase subunit 6/NADH:ubiquinone oxidoreductase subunit I